MDGREAMALSGGSGPYYIQRGVSAPSSASVTHTSIAAFYSQPGFRPSSNPQVHLQSNIGPTFTGEPKNVSSPRGIDMGVPSGEPLGEPVKKKRGRPRKYAPDGQVSLGLLPLPLPSKPKSLSGSDAPGHKRKKGRPPGTGRKQQLAALGEWMNSSAGQAFAPHVVTVGIGEDIVAKMSSFSQQSPRAVCILSGSGTVSSVTLRQPASSTPTVTYEGRFEILCLSGSYLLAEDGGPHSRTGGMSASLSTPDGQVIGGGVATLIASSLVQLVMCSFVYGGSKTKNKQLASPKGKDSMPQFCSETTTPASAPPTQHFTSPPVNSWPSSRPVGLRNPLGDIDMMRG
ncbi:AT-hook motif nuclear-localized protein 5 [Hibiscus syriacus]|uniref:AT-hook motif nuclear-localized protein n=1 Tax=Hibiscus syriacus TaxID=106335 RepID=A0A6A2X7F2_HIBSY|nr:AT-hook motif nuclear-localized protein 5-like [Hibiscus syriacus]KAE8671181.1 AT-hook motif nuclear-localized protein 5 [Hibiscus syriacus]